MFVTLEPALTLANSEMHRHDAMSRHQQMPESITFDTFVLNAIVFVIWINFTRLCLKLLLYYITSSLLSRLTSVERWRCVVHPYFHTYQISYYKNLESAIFLNELVTKPIEELRPRKLPQ